MNTMQTVALLKGLAARFPNERRGDWGPMILLKDGEAHVAFFALGEDWLIPLKNAEGQERDIEAIEEEVHNRCVRTFEKVTITYGGRRGTLKLKVGETELELEPRDDGTNALLDALFGRTPPTPA